MEARRTKREVLLVERGRVQRNAKHTFIPLVPHFRDESSTQLKDPAIHLGPLKVSSYLRHTSALYSVAISYISLRFHV